MRPTSLDAPRVIKGMISPALVIAALDHFGVPYIASHKEAVTNCPFHGDVDKPHLYINIAQKPGVFHCFYSDCEERGEFVSYLMRLTGQNQYSVLKTCRQLAKSVELGEVEIPTRQQSAFTDNTEDPLAPYRYRHEYLYERGLSEETLQRYDIGWNPENNELVIPWFSRTGDLVAIKMRGIASKYYRYIPGGSTAQTLFGLNHVKLHSIVWLCEGEIDAMSLDQVFRLAHFDNHFACALGGKEMPFDTQITQLVRKQPKTVVLMLDNDAPGRDAQHRLRAKLEAHVPLIEAVYPQGDFKDPNSLNYEQIVQTTLDVIQRLDQCADTKRQLSTTPKTPDSLTTVSS